MNDERDHDTEHIEKFLGLGKKKESKDDVDDASSTHNSTDGTANRKSGGWGVLSGWRKQADGQVEEPTYEGKDSGPTFETITPLNMGGKGPKPDENKPPAPKPKEEEPKEPTKENDGSYVPIGVDITPEQIAQHDARQNETTDDGQGVEDKEKIPEEFDPNESEDVLSEKKGSVLDDTAAGKQQSSWKPSVTSQRIMDAGVAGLNMFGNVLGGANKAFSMLRGLASALTSRQLMSDPTLPARGFLNAMEQSGQIVEDHIRQVGEAYGIKDGVKRDDLVGTYKGAQYYREKQQIENAEKQYYAGVGNALSAVFGNNVDVNDTVGIQNALAQMTPQQLSQLDDALFGRNGSLKDMYEATVVNPMGSTREQKARAQLLTTLNQSLKGQAQANAREAGRQRTQANQQIQQYNQENRRIKAGQEQQIAMAEQMLRDPTTMANISDDAQMETFVNAVLGRRINNKQIPTNRNGEVEIGTLKEEDLRALMNRLQQPEFQNLSGAMTLKNEVNDRLEAIKQNKAQTTAQNQANAIAPIANSPLDLDFRGPQVRRDEFGIPETTGRRNQLRDSAREMKSQLMSSGGSEDDIALCDNIILMCDMAEMRQNVFSDVQKMESNGIISPMDAEMIRSEARSAYRDLAGDLALTVAERDGMAQAGDDWRSTGRYEVTAHQMNMRGAKEYSDSIQAEYKQGLKDARDAERRERKRQEEIDKAARNARMSEQEKEAAMFDDRGIPRSPDDGPRDKCRKALRTSLSQVEVMLDGIPDTPENAYRRSALAVAKRETEKQLMRLDQEDHLQKMIQDARGQGKGDEATAKAEELRDRFYDWEEFGQALNDARDEMGMQGDRSWRSTKARQREAQAQSRQSAILSTLGRIETALGSIKDNTGSTSAGVADLLNYMKNDLKKDFKEYMDSKFQGQSISRGRQRQMFQDWFKDWFDTKVKDELKSSIDQAVSTITDKMKDNTDDLIQSVSDLDVTLQRQLNGVDKTMREKADALSKAMSDYYTGNKQSRKAHTDKVIQAIGEYNDAVKKIREKVNGMSTTGGSITDKAELNLTKEQKEKLDRTLTALESVSGNLQKFINNNGGDAKNIDPEALATAVLAAYQSMEQAKGDAEGSALEPKDDDEKLRTLKRMLEILEKHDKLYEVFNANREAKAYPVKLVDDAYSMVEQDLAQQDQNEAPSGAAYDDARNDASGTDQNVVPEATEPKEGEIYEDRYVDPNTGVYTPPAEKPVDPTGKVDMAVDELLDSLPALKEYTSKNPETLKFLRSEGPNGAVHQTLRGAAEMAEKNELFDGHAANVVLSMMDDLLSQTSRPQFKDTVKDWLQIADSQGDAQQVTDQRGVVQNIATMAETALEGVFRRDAARRLSMPPENVSEGTGETDPEAESIRRGLRIMEESLIEAQELASQGLDEGQIKQKMAESQAEQKKVAEEGTKAIVPEQDSEVGRRMAESVRNTLFYSKKGPQWADYRSVMDQLADMRSKYPQAINEIDKVREDIVLGMVVPQLMGFKNVANVAPSDKLSMDKIKEISRRAMEIGPTMWQDFPTMDELVDSHIYGKNKPEDPININRARVHRQEGGNRINNRLGEAFRAAAKDITLNDLAQSKLEDIRNNNLYSKFQNQIAQVGAGADRLPSADDLWARYKGKDGGLTIADVNTTLGSYRSAIANASDLKKKIEDYLSKNGLPKEVSNEYGKMEVPQGILQQMENARADHAKAAGMGNLDKFFAGGDVSKQLLSLEALKEQMYEDDLKKNYGFDDETIKEIIDKAHKKAGDSGNYEAHIGKIADAVVKERKKAEKAEQKAKEEAEKKKRFEDNSDSAKAKLEEIRNGLLDPKVKSAMDGVQRLEGEDDRKFLFERTVTGLRQIFKDNASLSAAGEALGLKEPGTKDWNINAPNPFTYIANALINGSGKLTDRKYDSVWPPREESKQEEDATDEVDDSAFFGDYKF